MILRPPLPRNPGSSPPPRLSPRMVVGFTLIPLGVALGLGALFALLCTLSYGWPPLLSYLLAGCALFVLVAASLVLAEQSR